MTTLYLTGVVTLELDSDKCNGCGMCLQVCPHAVFVLESKKAKIVAKDLCMECGACALNCPEAALLVQSGVGCAQGILNAMVRTGESSCDCSGDSVCC